MSNANTPIAENKSTTELVIWLDGLSCGDRVYYTDYPNFTESAKRLRAQEARITELDEMRKLNEQIINSQHALMVSAEQRGIAKATEEFATRIAELERDAAWQPIETAPKDGTMILLGLPEDPDDDSGPVSTAGRWQEGWEDSIDDMGCDDGFVDVDYQEFSPPRSFGATAYRSKGRQPTHWMPLPKAPAAIQESLSAGDYSQ